MSQWIHDQLYHFNILAVICIVIISTTISRASTNKELKSLSQEIYRNVEEVKDEIREKNNS